MSGRDPAADQLINYKNNQRNAPTATTSWGVPLANKDATLTVPHLYDGAPKHSGSSGYALLQDVHFLDELSHFDRERIPERVVHAKGAGAFGYFEVTHDITKYSSAKVFSEIGKRTPISVRFSTVGGESGSADTVRDPRGFAVKFYTEDGIWDLVGNNTPIFFIRDPILFPSFIHTQKRNPQTHLKDADMFWDFISLRAESTHQVCILFSDRGIPDGYRHMNGYGSHTFKLVTSNPSSGSADFVWCKFHYKTNQGIQNLPVDKAGELSGSDPDYGIKDLYNAIAAGNFPSWTFYVQIMTDEQARNSTFNPFDVTKVWPHSLYPLIPVGRLVLDQNPVNYFHDVEQAAYSPAHLVPGIEASPDRMLQGRLFSYDDTHRHRLGPNYTQIPVNCPYRNLSLNNPVHNYQRDGPNTVQYKNQIGAPNYHPNSFTGPEVDQRATKLQPPVKICPQAGGVQAYRYDSGDEDNYSQATVFYQKTLDAPARERLASNIAGHLSGAAEFIRERAVRNFTHVSPELGKRITELMPPVSSGVKANL